MRTRKKIFITYFAIIVIFSLIFLLIYNVSQNRTKANSVFFNESMLIKENFINSYKVQSNKVLIFLSLDCEYCTDAIKMIKQNKKKIIKKNSFVFIFNEEKKRINDFVFKNRDLLTDKIYVYADVDRKLYKAFGVSSYPTVFQLNQNIVLKSGYAAKLLPMILAKEL